MAYLENRGFSKNNLALFSLCEKIGLRVSARQRKLGDGSYKLCLEIFFPAKNEYIALSERLVNQDLGDAIFKAYLKYYTYLTKYGTIKYKEPMKVEIKIPEDHKCKYIKKVGESCILNDNCKFPNCETIVEVKEPMQFKF